MTVAPGASRIYQHNIQVAAPAAVMKAVVKDEAFAFQFLDGSVCQSHAVGSLQMGNVRQVLFQNQRLIITAGRVAIASTQDGDSESLFAVEAGHVLHERGLTRAAKSQVADADHRHGNRMAPHPTPLTKPDAQTNGPYTSQNCTT